MADLEALDATLLMFAPDFQDEAIRPKAFQPAKDRSKRGQMTRIILSISVKPLKRLQRGILPSNCSLKEPWIRAISGYSG